MSEEEKKAIEFMKFYKEYCLKIELENMKNYKTVNDGEFVSTNIETILNLIEKQEAIIKDLTLKNTQRIIDKVEVEVLDEFREENKKLKAELDKKDRIIYEIAKAFKQDDVRSVEEIKEYFEKKVGEK